LDLTRFLELQTQLACVHAVFVVSNLKFASYTSLLDLRAEGLQKSRVVPGLLNKVSYTTPHRFDCQINSSPGCHHNDWQHIVESLNAGNEIEAFFARSGVAGVVQIHQHQVEIVLFDCVDDGRW
jgi:hypothetical protein